MIEPKIGQNIYLSHKSLHGKKTLQENGAAWIVKNIQDNVMCCRFKRAMVLESLLTSNWRFVALENDRDFYWNISLK